MPTLRKNMYLLGLSPRLAVVVANFVIIVVKLNCSKPPSAIVLIPFVTLDFVNCSHKRISIGAILLSVKTACKFSRPLFRFISLIPISYIFGHVLMTIVFLYGLNCVITIARVSIASTFATFAQATPHWYS